MALATLCDASRSELNFTGFIVDHAVRTNSGEEAAKVAEELGRIGIIPQILKLDWSSHGNPKELSNFEAVARRLRYQAIGKACYSAGIRTLLLGHHADDQAETVLSRIVSGYLGAGLAGIQARARIPECEGIYGVDSSGRADLLSGPGEENHCFREMMLIERGGVNICRPLLPFTKDQLIQVCLAKEVKWFEDPTNADRQLTIRNAIRHLHQQAALPASLQRDSLCSLAYKAETRSATINAEVAALFDITDVQLDLRLGKVTFTIDHELFEKLSTFSQDTHRIKLALLRKLMQLVSSRSIQLQDLGNAVDVVFSGRHETQAIQIAKIHIRSLGNANCARTNHQTFVLFRQKPNNHDVLLASELQPHAKDPTAGWLLWDYRYWLRLQRNEFSDSMRPTCVFVRFLTPSMLGDLRKTLNREQRLALNHRLESAKEHGVIWTLPVVVARHCGVERVISLPSLQWKNPADAALCFQNSSEVDVDIRYKSVDFTYSERHHIIS